MSEFIIPDQIHQIQIEDGVLNLHPAYDTIHRFSRLGFSMLKYWNQESEPPTMCNVPINEEGAQFLVDECGLGTVHRDSITEHENEIYLQFAEINLEDQFNV